MALQKLLSLLLVLIFMIPEASTFRADTSERKIYKNGRTDPYKYNYYKRVRQLKPGPKGGGGRSKKIISSKNDNSTTVFWWPDASYKYV